MSNMTNVICNILQLCNILQMCNNLQMCNIFDRCVTFCDGNYLHVTNVTCRFAARLR